MMRIMDNGNVAPKNYKTSGSGIGNMKMRTRQLGGSITLSTENGYQITLKIKSF